MYRRGLRFPDLSGSDDGRQLRHQVQQERAHVGVELVGLTGGAAGVERVRRPARVDHDRAGRVGEDVEIGLLDRADPLDQRVGLGAAQLLALLSLSRRRSAAAVRGG